VITDDAGSTADAKTPTAAADASTATGEVTAVSTIADASSGVSSYPVTVDFTDDSGDFNVGATVLVDITIAEVQDVVQVPSFAVTTDGDSSTVTVTKDGKEETREVTTGLTSGGMVEITSGLEAGEEVVIKLGGRFGGNGGTGGTGTQGGEAPVFQVGPEGIVTEGR
jgi:macrolide-specific efflux system membrane fusion protein